MDNKHNDRRIFDLAMHTWLYYALVFLKWLLLAAVIGAALGLISTAFHYSVDFAQELRLAYPWLLCLLPIGGLIIVFMYRACGVKDDRGANAVLEATINGEPVKKRVAPLIFIGTVLTHLFGGSAGREGAALQLGGSIAGLFGGVFHIKPEDGRVLTICGMSAAFSALFGTPITAAVFAVGVASAGAVQHRMQRTKTSGFSSVLTHTPRGPSLAPAGQFTLCRQSRIEHKGLRPLINPGG